MKQESLDILVALGFPARIFRFQPACHNKCIIVDKSVVMFGSHNWSNEGVKTNRDASLIFHDKEIAEYLAEVYEYDWNRLATAHPTKARPARGQDRARRRRRVCAGRILRSVRRLIKARPHRQRRLSGRSIAPAPERNEAEMACAPRASQACLSVRGCSPISAGSHLHQISIFFIFSAMNGATFCSSADSDSVIVCALKVIRDWALFNFASDDANLKKRT